MGRECSPLLIKHLMVEQIVLFWKEVEEYRKIEEDADRYCRAVTLMRSYFTSGTSQELAVSLEW